MIFTNLFNETWARQNQEILQSFVKEQQDECKRENTADKRERLLLTIIESLQLAAMLTS